MSDEFEAIGTAAEGLMVGRVFEKPDGENTVEAEHGTSCLNCGTTLIGSHCHACGQSAHVHRSISAFWHDILHGVLHFDGKFWNTLPLLAWKPGELTRRYIHGERAKFISPMAIFLFTVFMMFVIFSFVGSPGMADAADENSVDVAGADWSADMRAQQAELEGIITANEAELSDPDLTTAERADLMQATNKAKEEVNVITFATTGSAKYPEVLSQEAGNSIINSSGEMDTGIAWFDSWITKATKKANSNPELVLYKLKSNGYKFAWLLIPLSIPFVWLVTIGKRGHRFYDHAVFTTYSLSFMSILFIACALSVKLNILPGLVITAATFYAPFHLYRQLRHAYGLSRIGAVLRLSVLLMFITMISVVFFLLLLGLGALS